MSANFYAGPSHMLGGAFTIYSGTRRQRGGSFFGSLKKIMVPVGQSAVRGLKAAARNPMVQSAAKRVLEQGIALGTNVAVDALQGRNVGESIRERAREGALQALTGTPTGSAPTQTPKRKRKRPRKLKQRKATPVHATSHQPPAKRRKTSRSQTAVKKRKRSLSRAALNREELF